MRTVLNKEAYMEIYAAKDPLEYYDGLLADGKQITKYGLPFKTSRRQTLAMLEHLRWNAFMISKGFVPATKAEICANTSNGKNYILRKHGNLTTHEGLIEFRKLVAARDGKDESETDVIKYDYQLLDDAFWLLTQNGYRIVRKAHKR